MAFHVGADLHYGVGSLPDQIGRREIATVLIEKSGGELDNSHCADDSGWFTALAQRITRVGELGSGQTVKLCNQLIVASNLVAIAEALTLAADNGLDPGILPDALTGGFADSIPLQIFGRRMAAHVTDPKLGELALMLKDLTAVETLARARRVQLPLAAAALRVYEQAAGEGLIEEDLGALISLYERQIARSRTTADEPTIAANVRNLT